MVAFALVRHQTIDYLPALQRVGAYQLIYNLVGYGYVLAWGISFYPQLLLNYQRKSTAGMSIGFLWYNLFGFALYLVYTTFARDCTVQDQIFAGHALFITFLTLMQVPWYSTNKLGEFPVIHGKVAGALLLALDVCLVLNMSKWMSFMTLIFACGYLKTAISLVKYTPQFYLNWQRKSTVGFAMGMVFCDLAGGVLSISQQLVSCQYDASTGSLRPEWTWQPFVGNKPKLFLGLIAIVYDLAFLYQHLVLYGATSSVSSPESTAAPKRAAPIFSGEDSPAQSLIAAASEKDATPESGVSTMARPLDAVTSETASTSANAAG
jgi:cystinosin